MIFTLNLLDIFVIDFFILLTIGISYEKFKLRSLAHFFTGF